MKKEPLSIEPISPEIKSTDKGRQKELNLFLRLEDCRLVLEGLKAVRILVPTFDTLELMTHLEDKFGEPFKEGVAKQVAEEEALKEWQKKIRKKRRGPFLRNSFIRFS